MEDYTLGNIISGFKNGGNSINGSDYMNRKILSAPLRKCAHLMLSPIVLYLFLLPFVVFSGVIQYDFYLCEEVDFCEEQKLYGIIVNTIFIIIFITTVFIFTYVYKNMKDQILRITYSQLLIVYVIDFLFYCSCLEIEQLLFLTYGAPLYFELALCGRLFELIIMIILLVRYKPCLFDGNKSANNKLLLSFIFFDIALIILPLFLKGATADFFHEIINLIVISQLIVEQTQTKKKEVFH